MVDEAPQEPNTEVIVHKVHILSIVGDHILFRIHRLFAIYDTVPAFGVWVVESVNAKVAGQGNTHTT